MKNSKIQLTLMGVAILFSVLSPTAWAAEALPADQVIAAIRTAVAAYPGKIQEAEVELKQGRLLVEVEIIRETGEKIEVYVDPEKNEIHSIKDKS